MMNVSVIAPSGHLVTYCVVMQYMDKGGGGQHYNNLTKVYYPDKILKPDKIY